MRRFALVAWLLALLAPYCARAADTQAASLHPTSMPDAAEIRRMLTVRVDLQKRATGIVVGVTGPNGHRIIAYGVRSLEDRTPVDGRTVYGIGSLTKVFTALLLAQDVQSGRLRLDEPVRDCVPTATGFLSATGGREPTFADLATHTSGLPLRPDNLPSKDPDDKYAGYTEARLLAYLSSFKPSRPPGAAYEYSNVGYGLLGLALSRCDHADYATLLRERVTGPLGLSDTSLEPTAGMHKREAVGYDLDFRPLPHEEVNVLAPAGDLKSTADDLLTFLDAALERTPTGLAPAFEELTKIRRPGGMEPATGIALGWNIYEHDGRTIIWKNGNVDGYRAFMGYDPEAKIGIVALANMLTPEGADDIGLHLLDPSYPANLKVPRPHHQVAIDPATLDRYVGDYKFSDGSVFSVSRTGDRLFVTPPGSGPLPMYPEGDDRFFLKIVDAELTFGGFASGHATRLVWSQEGPDDVGMRTGS